MKYKIARTLFLVIAIINLSGHLMESNELAKYSKVLLMPLLLYYVFEKSREKVTFRILLLSVAIIFSWGGDIALIYPDYFLLGVGLFLIAQLSYAYLFIKSTIKNIEFSLFRLLPYLVYAFLLFYLVLPGAESLKIPVIVYGICLLAMGYAARLRRGLTGSESFKLTLIGSTLFIISDSLIAIEKFYSDIPFGGFLVMLTYISAQFLIAEGMLKHTE